MAARKPPGGEFDARLGALSARLSDLAETLREKLEEAAASQPGDRPRPKSSFDIRVRGLAPEGDAAEPRFARVRPQRARPTRAQGQPSAMREPLIDVFDESEAVVVTIEAAGAREEEISIELEGERLSVLGAGPHPFAGAAALPPGLSLARCERSFINGVLTLRFARTAGEPE